MSPEDQRKAQGNLSIGLVVNEYLDEFHRGDFLVRNLLGGDPNSGVLAVGALPRMGQTIQFQRRDAAAADEDMNELLGQAPRAEQDNQKMYGGCLFCCNGRGKNLFGRPAMTPRWCSSISTWPVWADFSAMAKSGRWAKRIFFTATPPPWRYL